MKVTWGEFFEVCWRAFLRDWPALSFLTVAWVTLASAGFAADVRLFGFAVPLAAACAFLLGWNACNEARVMYAKKKSSGWFCGVMPAPSSFIEEQELIDKGLVPDVIGEDLKKWRSDSGRGA